MKNETLNLIEQAISAGVSSSEDISDFSLCLDETLGHDTKSNNVRNFFDSWADAINHDYFPYKEKRLSEWLSSAEEIKLYYLTNKPLSNRKIWQEVGVARA